MRIEMLTVALFVLTAPALAHAQDAVVLPHAGIKVSIASEKVDALHEHPHHLAFSLGLSYYPGTMPWFASAGLEFEPFARLDERDALYIMPSMRLGWTWADFMGDPVLLSAIAEPLSRSHVYVLAGFRPESRTRDPMLRLGVGAKSTSLMMATFFQIPANVELVYEVAHRHSSVVSFRFGWGF